MIQGITNINSYLNAVKMQTLWEINKQDPEKARIEKQQKQQEISKKVSDIRSKLKSGKKLSEKEMRLLREHAPELYKKAEAVQQERKNFKEALKSCKTKDDVQRLVSQKLGFSMSIAKQDQEMAEYMTAAIQDEHASFTASDDYKGMKWESELNTDTDNKTEKVSKSKKKEKSQTIDEVYEQVLQRAEQLTVNFDVSEDGVVSPKQTTTSDTTAPETTTTLTQVQTSYQTTNETTESKGGFTKKV